jgi:penicillin amidase
VRWTAHDPSAVNFRAIDLERAATVEDALDIAASSGIPAQNFICADADGRIGWTIMGRIPRRDGCDGRLPVGVSCTWQGWLPARDYPRVVDPAAGRLWTANNRVIDAPGLAVLGDGGYDLGARARQIRDALFELEDATEPDMLAIQLDDRALFLERWRGLLLELLDADAVSADSRRAAARRFVEAWGARAAVDSVGYRLVREFHRTVRDEILASVAGVVLDADPDFRFWYLGQVEAALWRLASEQPHDLLPSGVSSWRDLLLAAFDHTLDGMLGTSGSLEEATWGARNTVRIRHPLSLAVPALGRWLDMPAVQLPGDSDMPRVQHPGFGASERMVVSPGHEAEGIFHMPCGQSGHPLSPFYRAGHEAWVRGEATPFLPGEARHELRLLPGG